MSIQRTGRERSIADLVLTDVRNAGQILIAPDGTLVKQVEAEDVQAPFLRAESGLGHNVPAKIRQRIETARKLADYGWFCYEFYAVSMFWSISCMEMALRMKFTELNSSGPIVIVHKSKASLSISVNELKGYLKKRWRIAGLPDFDLSFKAHLNWAAGAGMLPANTDVLPLVTLRNSMAHPEYFNWVVPADHPRIFFKLLTEIVARLWP